MHYFIRALPCRAWHKLVLCLTVGIPAGALAQSPIVTTVAGTTWLYPTSSVRALNAPLSSDIYGLLDDGKGNLLICDTSNNLVLRLSPDGGRLAFVSHGGDGKVSVIDTEKRAVVSQITLPPLKGGGYLLALQKDARVFDTEVR